MCLLVMRKILRRLFFAKRTIVGGSSVLLGRKDASKKWDQFDELTTEEDLEEYKKGVYKYL